MNNIITFGKYHGKSFEWLFFNAPWYAQWMHDNNIHRQRHNFGEEEGEYFEELYRRASHITGTCKHCGKQPITRMGLSTRYKDCSFAGVGFYCDECTATEHLTTRYIPPSFFDDEWECMRRNMHLRITKTIHHYFIGDLTLTQARMEKFFRDDGRFVNATPGFFPREYAVALGYD
jgi:hypothetical protein